MEEEKITPSHPIFKPAILPDFQIGDGKHHHGTPRERVSRAVGGAACDAYSAYCPILPPEAEAAKFVKEHDHARRRYVRRYFNAEIDDPTLYDATLNTGRFGFAGAAEVIAQMALQHRYTDRLLTLV